VPDDRGREGKWKMEEKAGVEREEGKR